MKKQGSALLLGGILPFFGRRTWSWDDVLKNKASALLLGVILSAVGIGITIWGGKMFKSANASASWPTVEGTVTLCDVKKRGRSYKVSFLYKYTVDGRKHSSDKVCFGQEFRSGAGLGMKVVNYPRGKEVQVHYNPRNPEVAVLESGVSSSSYAVLGVGIFIAVSGVLVFLLGVKGNT